MLRILADENVPNGVIGKLIQLGHDVVSVKKSMRSESDRVILERAEREARLIVTFDKDFGDLAFRFGLAQHCGIILFRSRKHPRKVDIEMVLNVILSRTDWQGHFAVVKGDRIRIRPLLSRPQPGVLE